MKSFNMLETLKRHDVVLIGGVKQKVISFKNGWVACCPVSKCGSFAERVENTNSFRLSQIDPIEDENLSMNCEVEDWLHSDELDDVDLLA